MASAIALREDFSAVDLRALARASRDSRQCRRLLALAAVADGRSQQTEPIHAKTDFVHRVCQRGHRKRGGKGFQAAGTMDILSHGVVLPFGFAAPGA